MSRRAPRRLTGRRPALTPQIAAEIVALVEAGNYVQTAAQVVGLNPATVWQWLQKGEEARTALADGEALAPQAQAYIEFVETLTRARARAEVHAVGVVQQVMVGGFLIEETPVVAKDGTLVRDPETGDILYARKYAQPDGKLAMEYLSRSAPDRWSREPAQRLEVTPDAAAAIDSDDTAVSLAARLAALQAERRGEIEAAPEDVVDVEVIEDDA